MIRSYLPSTWMLAFIVFLVVQLASHSAFSQYANKYANNGSSSTSQLTSGSPSKRSGYAHSGMSLGMLHSEGYDDLADFRPPTSADGQYRKPKAIELFSAAAAIISTSSGALYDLDLRSGEIQLAYSDASRSWSKLLVLDQQHLAAIDLAQDEVVVLEYNDHVWRPIASLAAYGRPHSLAWDSHSRTLFVTGQWSQRLYRFRANDQLASWRELPFTDIPLNAGAMVYLPKRELLIVADAFGGDYLVLRTAEAQTADGGQAEYPLSISNQTRLFAQNIPSLHVVEDENWILFPFQLLNPETHSVQGDITWGGLLSNNLRWLKADRMLTMQGDEVMKQSKFLPLGEVGNGSGDPTSLRMTAGGKFAVTLGGTDRVAVGQFGEREIQQFPVGLHPIGSVFSTDGNQLFVVNEFCDSVSKVDLNTSEVRNIPLGQLREPTLIERGERLFFHSKLAHDGWMSCHSCHSQGHTSGQLNDNTSDGSLGSPKRILSLLGQAQTAPYSWSGEILELEQQVLNSLQSTMATDHQISKGTVEAIAAYVRSLPPPPSLKAARKEGLAIEQEAQGRRLFEQLACNNCHAGTTHTSEGRFDVNLPDERGQTEFNPPSLVGVSQRSRSLLHDGRAKSIKEVFAKYEHQLPRQLEASEVDLLVSYLEGL